MTTTFLSMLVLQAPFFFLIQLKLIDRLPAINLNSAVSGSFLKTFRDFPKAALGVPDTVLEL